MTLAFLQWTSLAVVIACTTLTAILLLSVA